MPRVRVVSRALFALAGKGPIVAVQGEGLLLGLRTRRPAKEIQAELLAERVEASRARPRRRRRR